MIVQGNRILHDPRFVSILIVMDVLQWYREVLATPYQNGVVSILIVMDVLQWWRKLKDSSSISLVSILIVMDVLQWFKAAFPKAKVGFVSILIVMDVLQWWFVAYFKDFDLRGLNPYCNGCTSMIQTKLFNRISLGSLNPYCNGCTSMINETRTKRYIRAVSILIVMDVLQWYREMIRSGDLDGLSQSLL